MHDGPKSDSLRLLQSYCSQIIVIEQLPAAAPGGPSRRGGDFESLVEVPINGIVPGTFNNLPNLKQMYVDCIVALLWQMPSLLSHSLTNAVRS
jgi:hypothetical protein